MIEELKKIKAEKRISTYNLALDIGVSYSVLYKYLNNMKITDRMKYKIENFIKIQKGEKPIITKVNKFLLKRWTPIAKECYARNCNCDGCEIVPKDSFHGKCNIKEYVKAYFLLGIYPNKRGNNET